MRSCMLAALLVLGAAIIGMAADVLVPGFTVDAYATGIPDPSNLAIDIDTGTLFYGEFGEGLYRVDPGGMAVPVNLSFALDVGDWYPFAATELEYADGYIYSLLPAGTLARVDTTTGAAVPVYSYSGIHCESGIALRDDTLYMVPGHGWADSLLSYNLLTGVGETAVSGLPHSAFGIEYDAANDRLFFSDSSTGLYEVDLDSGSIALIGSFTAHALYRQFAIDPTGAFAYSMNNFGVVERMDLATGMTEFFITGLSDTDLRDLAFGPASDGTGWSLYLLQPHSILEVSGFQGPQTETKADNLLTDLVAKVSRALGVTLDQAQAIVQAHGAARVRLALAFSASYTEFIAALEGYALSSTTAGSGGGIEGAVVASECVIGDPLVCSFQITHPFTGQFVENAVCSLSLVFEGSESPIIVAIVLAPFDETVGGYAASVETAGLEAGAYTLYIACGDLQPHQYTVNMVNP